MYEQGQSHPSMPKWKAQWLDPSSPSPAVIAAAEKPAGTDRRASLVRSSPPLLTEGRRSPGEHHHSLHTIYSATTEAKWPIPATAIVYQDPTIKAVPEDVPSRLLAQKPSDFKSKFTKSLFRPQLKSCKALSKSLVYVFDGYT